MQVSAVARADVRCPHRWRSSPSRGLRSVCPIDGACHASAKARHRLRGCARTGGSEVSAVVRSFASPREAWSEWRSAPVGNSWAHGHRGCDRFRSFGLSARRFCRWPVCLGSAEGWARRQGFAGAARHPSPDEARALACTGFADEKLCQLRAATPRERRRDAAVTALIRRRSHQGGARLGRLQPPQPHVPVGWFSCR